MADFDVFNGDADGICALLQLRQVEPRQSTLVTGVKRDIALLDRVTPAAGDRVTVLDVSLDKNRESLKRILDLEVPVFYVDHHHAGDIPDSPHLTAIINTASEVSTSLLVNQHLGDQRLGWAVIGCFGDNLNRAAEGLAKGLSYSADLTQWRELGVLINYNGYGSAIEDLHFPPAELYARLQPHQDPNSCLSDDPDLIATLRTAYGDDMTRAEKAPRIVEDEHIAVVQLPDAPWSRRVSGVYGNSLANSSPDRAHAVLTDTAGGYLVSVRAPLTNRTGADEVCRQFATGGGRAAAAGINQLPVDDLDRFVDRLRAQYA